MTVMTHDDDVEVPRQRRRWPAQYKLDILAEIDAAKAPGVPGPRRHRVGASDCRRRGQSCRQRRTLERAQIRVRGRQKLRASDLIASYTKGGP